MEIVSSTCKVSKLTGVSCGSFVTAELLLIAIKALTVLEFQFQFSNN